MFTPAIFTEMFRSKIQAWGYPGFLPKSKASAAQNKKMKQGNNIRNYHAQLSAVLDSFITEGPQLRNVLLPIGQNGSMRVDVITCLLFVIQDMQEGDQLCGRMDHIHLVLLVTVEHAILSMNILISQMPDPVLCWLNTWPELQEVQIKNFERNGHNIV